MVKTAYGTFNGDTWEDFCQVCFRIKYEDEGYQRMPAWQGDLGIEGFTRTGRVFQCYCPDADYPPDKLYEEQRDKISTDLKKLETYEKSLASYLKDTKIKQWIFVTPEYKKKDLVKHCRAKAEELIKKKLSILDDDFDVLIYEIDFFSAEIPIVLKFRQKKLEITPGIVATDSEVADWKSKQNSLVANAIRKHGARLPNNVNLFDDKVNRLTNFTIDNYLNGNILIRKWQDSYPEDYEKFVRVVSQFERKVEEKCILNLGDNNALYCEIELELKHKLKESFSYLEELMIDKLTDQVMADWILRCPINFD